MRVKRLLDLLVDNYRDNRPRSFDWARLVVNVHLEPFFGKTRAAALSSAKLHAYKRQRRRRVKDNTINREMALLRRAYTLGAEHMPPLVVRVPRIPILPEPPPRKGFFEYEEFTGLRSELPEPLRPVLPSPTTLAAERGRRCA